jgi:two-component system KDP operon response regulator KdpE
MENVLVVEDEANILKFVTVNLMSRGYKVAEAKNGTEALSHLRTEPPSLMVMDIKLPDITGWEVLRLIRRDQINKIEFPVLVMTASITDAYIDLEAYPNVIEVLIKPFSSGKLLSAVQRALRPRM